MKRPPSRVATFRAIAITIAAAIVIPLTAGSAVASTRVSHLSRPTFVIPKAMRNLHVTIGEKINLSYCVPQPMPGKFCGGPFVHGQTNPTGGHHGPYYFEVRGLVPFGLTLHGINGLLTGTVSKLNKPRTWSFAVCVSDSTRFPAPGTTGSTCDNAVIVVTKPKPPTTTTTTAPIPTTSTTTSTTATSTTTTSTTTTTTTVPSSNWYLHWNCLGASDCVTNFMGANTGTYAAIYNEADCEGTAQVFNGVYAPESPFYCDTSPTA